MVGLATDQMPREGARLSNDDGDGEARGVVAGRRGGGRWRGLDSGGGRSREGRVELGELGKLNAESSGPDSGSTSIDIG
jgi:hypothetical protein